MIRILLLLCFINAAAFAQEDPAHIYLERAQVEEIVQDYLMNNGDIILKSVENYQIKIQAEEAERAAEAIKGGTEFLFDHPLHPVSGNAQGDITIVEFFDYNCGYCKKARDTVQDVLAQDDKIRFVFIDTPILSQESREAAKWALAAGEQGKYLEYHMALMALNGAVTKERLENLAKTQGLDMALLEKTMADPKWDEYLNNNIKQMRNFGIGGTPAFIVGDEVIGGYVPAAALLEIVLDQREKLKE